MESNQKLGLEVNDELMELWKNHYKSCLQHALDTNNNRDCYPLFLDDINNDNDDNINNEYKSKQLFQILSTVKLFNLTQYGHNKDAHNDPSKFWCRINIFDLIINKKMNDYNNNKFVYIEFVIDTNASLDCFDSNALKIRSQSKNLKMTSCTFTQFPNMIYNELFIYMQKSDLIYIILDYLPFDDYIKENSKKWLQHNIKPQTMTKQQMLNFNLITFYREFITINDKNNIKYYAEFDNNQTYICNQYGNMDKKSFLMLLKAISNIEMYLGPPIQSRYPWRRLEEKDFKTGFSIDVRFSDEHGEISWTVGTICRVQTDRILIHIPRFGAVWRDKNANDIAPTGAHTEGIH